MDFSVPSTAQGHIRTNRQTDRQTETQRERQTETVRQRQTDRDTERERERENGGLAAQTRERMRGNQSRFMTPLTPTRDAISPDLRYDNSCCDAINFGQHVRTSGLRPFPFSLLVIAITRNVNNKTCPCYFSAQTWSCML